MPIPEQYVKSGRITRDVKAWVKGYLRPGLRYADLSKAVEDEIRARGGAPAFPCGVGVDSVTAHFAPQESDRSLFTEKDLIKVDFGTHVDGYVTDTAVTVTFNSEYGLMLEATERALATAIEVAKKDGRVGEIGSAVFKEASRFGFKTIENLTGHTVDRYMVHAGKSIPNVYIRSLQTLAKGDVFAIEPFLTPASAAGYVVDGQSVTIFSVVARKRTGDAELDAFVEAVWAERKTLPFTPRWYTGNRSPQEVDEILRKLVAKRVVKAYPTLVEASGSPVAQVEHTMALDAGGLVVLT